MTKPISTGGISTNISTIVSGGNSTITPLAAGDIFVGAWEVTDNFTSAMCSLITDKVGILIIEFSVDSVSIDHSTSYAIEAATNETHRISINRKYMRIKFINADVLDQTYLRIQTIYGNFALVTAPLNATTQPDADALLAKSVLHGNDAGVVTPINSADGALFTREYGDVGLNRDAWGVKKVSIPKTLFHGMFTFDIPSSKWMMYENGVQVYTSTNIVSTNGAGTITTSATKTVVTLESRVCPRYQPNRGHLFSTAVICPNKTNDGIREWGLCTLENKVLFRLKADGKLYAVLVSGTVQKYEQEIDTSALTNFNVEGGNVYDIQYQWRGVGNYKFYINLTLVHIFDYLGTLTALSMENPALPACFKATRTTQDVSIIIGCADISSENGDDDHLEYGSSYAEGVSVGTNAPVIVIRQPLLINGKTNTRDLTLARITFNCSKKAVFKVWSTRDATGISGATYKVVKAGTFVETDSPNMDATAVRATSVTLAKLSLITAVAVEPAVPREVTNPRPHEVVFPIVRGDYIVVTCTASAATADCVIEWGEQI